MDQNCGARNEQGNWEDKKITVTTGTAHSTCNKSVYDSCPRKNFGQDIPMPLEAHSNDKYITLGRI